MRHEMDHQLHVRGPSRAYHPPYLGGPEVDRCEVACVPSAGAAVLIPARHGPRQLLDAVPPVVARRKRHRHEAVVCLRRVHPVAREGAFCAEVAHESVAVVERPGVILAEGPQHDVVGAAVPREVTHTLQHLLDLARKRERVGARTVARERRGSWRADLFWVAAGAFSPVFALLGVQVAVQTQVIRDDEQGRLERCGVKRADWGVQG